jgi:hypothetical protein
MEWRPIEQDPREGAGEIAKSLMINVEFLKVAALVPPGSSCVA